MVSLNSHHQLVVIEEYYTHLHFRNVPLSWIWHEQGGRASVLFVLLCDLSFNTFACFFLPARRNDCMKLSMNPFTQAARSKSSSGPNKLKNEIKLFILSFCFLSSFTSWAEIGEKGEREGTSHLSWGFNKNTPRGRTRDAEKIS